MNDGMVLVSKGNPGMIAAIIACVLAVLGILFLGTVFVPIAMVVAIISTIISVRNKNNSAIGVSALAWVLVVIGFVTSPVLLALIGVGVAA